MFRKRCKYLLLLSGIFFFFGSCVQKAEELPLPESDLIKILADLHLAEAAFQNLTTSAKDTLAYMYYEQVYEIHGVTKAEVDSCIAIMNRQPEQFFETYKKVQEHLVAGAADNLNRKEDKKK